MRTPRTGSLSSRAPGKRIRNSGGNERSWRSAAILINASGLPSAVSRVPNSALPKGWDS